MLWTTSYVRASQGLLAFVSCERSKSNLHTKFAWSLKNATFGSTPEMCVCMCLPLWNALSLLGWFNSVAGGSSWFLVNFRNMNSVIYFLGKTKYRMQCTNTNISTHLHHKEIVGETRCEMRWDESVSNQPTTNIIVIDVNQLININKVQSPKGPITYCLNGFIRGTHTFICIWWGFSMSFASCFSQNE